MKTNLNLILSVSACIALSSTTACSKSDDSSDKGVTSPSSNSDTATADGVAAQTPAADKVVAGGEEGTVVDGGPASEKPGVDGATEATAVAIEVDATNKEAWVFFDLDTSRIVVEADATWDLAFKRTSVKMASNVTAAVLRDVTFDAVVEAPATGYAADAPITGGLETDGLFFHAPTPWYTYNMENHTINSRNYVYVIKSNAGHDIKVALTDYYNVDRLPAFIQLKTLDLGVSAAQIVPVIVAE